MKKTKFTAMVAAVCSLLVLLFLFVRISIAEGEWVMVTQLPLRFGTNATPLNLLESILTTLVSVLMVVFCIRLCVESCRKNPAPERIRREQRFLMLPLICCVLGALERIAYIFTYEGEFSFRFNWAELLKYIVLLLVYALTAYGKLSSAFWLVLLCLLNSLVEVSFFVIPDLSPAYVAGVNIYISTFVSALMFYLAYAAIGASIGATRQAASSAGKSPDTKQ